MPYLLKRKAEKKEKPKPHLALVNDIGTATRFVEEDFGDVTASHKSLVAIGQITFDLIWTICPPGAIILAPKHGLMHQMHQMPNLATGRDPISHGTSTSMARSSLVMAQISDGAILT